MSIGFDGKCAWIGGNKFSSKTHARSPKILRQQVVYMCTYKLKHVFTINYSIKSMC